MSERAWCNCRVCSKHVEDDGTGLCPWCAETERRIDASLPPIQHPLPVGQVPARVRVTDVVTSL